jgi:hypothetical protein
MDVSDESIFFGLDPTFLAVKSSEFDRMTTFSERSADL